MNPLPRPFDAASPITRRNLLRNAMTLSMTAIACPLLSACGDDTKGDSFSLRQRPRPPKEKFRAGAPDQYREDGIYFNHYESHGVYLVTHHGQLAVLIAKPSDSHCVTRYNPDTNQYVNPCNGYRYSFFGLATGDPKPRPALDRCRISISIDPYVADDPYIVVDPTQLYRFDDNEWSDQNSIITLSS